VNRHHDQGNSYKGQHLIGAGLQVQRFSSLIIIIKAGHGGIQAGMVQEELRVLHLHLKAASRLTSRQLG
jgi:N-acetylmuramoyl-L-alanine amidase